MNAEIQKEHVWLQKFIGEWTYKTEAIMEAGKPPEIFTGTESVRSLGEIWIVAEGQGELPGGDTAATMMTLGFDPQKKRFVGTWVGSMMNYLWIYDGELDSTEKALVLNAEGPGMSDDNKMATYKDVIEFKDNDHRVLTSHVLNEHGDWHEFMTTTYLRQ